MDYVTMMLKFTVERFYPISDTWLSVELRRKPDASEWQVVLKRQTKILEKRDIPLDISRKRIEHVLCDLLEKTTIKIDPFWLASTCQEIWEILFPIKQQITQVNQPHLDPFGQCLKEAEDLI
ncbi:MAG: hypothetical protein ACFFBD_01870, partial [Candidatus Hodarchaeota archaeon]